jgi:D-alanyl-D-alanine carboxypeptidase
MKKIIYQLAIIITIFLGGNFLITSAVSAAALPAVTGSQKIAVTLLNDINYNYPWSYDALSPVYQIEASSSAAISGKKPLILKITYATSSDYYKQVLYYDQNKAIWTPLPTQDNPKIKQVTVIVPFSYVRLAVFARTDILSIGQASWYVYQNGLYAASPDFPIGSVVRVYNLANNKHVDVTINDYGPDRSHYPNRVLDLDKAAFRRIASLGDGIIKVQVEPLRTAKLNMNKAVKPSTAPSIESAAAVVIRESDGKILYGKNATSTSPLASLTKLVAMTVFLETRPDLNTVVTYKVQDENYNYQYCSKWQSARLLVKDGETLTIGDLLYSALVGSANNAVESLVRVSGLSRPDFIEKMNETVQGWGATSTKFVEPTGLSPDNVSSPEDYAIIAREVYRNPIIQKVSTTLSYSFSTINTKKKHIIRNTDNLLQYNKLNIIGSKTGYLDEAGYCLMTRIKNPAGNLIVVTFKAKTRADSLSDHEKLIQYGLKFLKA